MSITFLFPIPNTHAYMSTFAIIAIICAVVGILGSVVPGLPGPPLSWVALLLMYLDKTNDGISMTALIVWFIVVAVVTVLDYVIPAIFTKATGGHKAASIGATIGLFAGMFMTPIGMIGGSLLGAFLGEYLVENGGTWASFKASIGAFLGFIVTMVMKVICASIILWKVIAILF